MALAITITRLRLAAELRWESELRLGSEVRLVSGKGRSAVAWEEFLMGACRCGFRRGHSLL